MHLKLLRVDTGQGSKGIGKRRIGLDFRVGSVIVHTPAQRLPGKCQKCRFSREISLAFGGRGANAL